MKAFNAFQMTVLLMAWPFIIDWLSKGTFSGAGIAYWIAIISAIVHFVFNVVAYIELFEKM